MTPRPLAAATAIALSAASAPAQFPARPAAKVEFTYVRSDPSKPNYYELSGVAEPNVARRIEERLFPRTFLRSATAEDESPYVVTARLEERDAQVESATFIEAFLVFGLSGGHGRFSDKRPLPAGLAFELRFREKRGDNSAAGFLRELDECLEALATNPVDLVDGLLCHVPVYVRDAASPRDAFFFQAQRFDEAKGDFEATSLLGLPLWQSDIGLGPQSKFLLEVDVEVGGSRTTLFHLVRASADSASELLPTIPDYLRDAIAVTGVPKAESAATREASAPVDAASGAIAARKAVARFVPQIPLAVPRAPLDVHHKLDASPHAVETRRVWVAECMPMDAASTVTRPSQKASGAPQSGAPRP